MSPSSLRFDTSNWNKAQTITVYGEDDLIRDGLVDSEVKVAINKQDTLDSKYAVLMSQSLPVSTIDDGVVAMVSLAASSTSVDESGGQAILEVKQNVVSLADTLVTLNPSGTATLNSDYSLSSTSLIIPAGSREVNTTLQAISDHIDEAVEKVEVSISSVSGGNGAKAENQSIEVSINDDDVSEFTVAASGGFDECV